MKSTIYFTAITILFFCSCNTQHSNHKTTDTEQIPSETAEQISSINNNNVSIFDELLKNWDEAHNTKNMQQLTNLYAPNIFYYTKSISLDEFAKIKKVALDKCKDYTQKSTFTDNTIYDDRTEIYFDKTYTANGKTSTVKSILILSPIDAKNEEYKIIEESDLPSKKYLKKSDKQATEEIDFNNDGKKEYAEIIKPIILENEMECKDGECITKIQFSDKSIPTIEIKNCIGGMLELEGDLDNDGNPEIGIVDDWFTSRWGRYIVYTLKNNIWKEFTTLSIDRFAVMDDAKLRSSLVRKINNTQIEVSNFVWSDEQEDMIIKKSILKLDQ